MPTKPPAPSKKASPGKTAYEQQRAAKAGKSHEDWLKAKVKAEAEATTSKKAAPKPVKKPGLIGRLLEKAHKPL